MRPISRDPTYMSVEQVEKVLQIRRPAWTPWQYQPQPPRHASAVRKAVKLEVEASHTSIRKLLKESAKKVKTL